MTIFNRDGTKFELMDGRQHQEIPDTWGEDYILHNFFEWEPVVFQDGRTRRQAPPPVKKREPVVEATPVLKPQPQPKPENVSKFTPEFTQAKEEPEAGLPGGVWIECLPAVLREKRDPLYGDVFRTIEYGETYRFEGVVTAQEDMAIQIWSRKQLAEGSVLFPRTGEVRWWRVTESKAFRGGYLTHAIVSDYQPHFAPAAG